MWLGVGCAPDNFGCDRPTAGTLDRVRGWSVISCNDRACLPFRWPRQQRERITGLCCEFKPMMIVHKVCSLLPVSLLSAVTLWGRLRRNQPYRTKNGYSLKKYVTKIPVICDVWHTAFRYFLFSGLSQPNFLFYISLIWLDIGLQICEGNLLFFFNIYCFIRP